MRAVTAFLMSHKFDEVVKAKDEAQSQLAELEHTHGLTLDYFLLQWERQRTCQLEMMGHTNLQHLELQLGRLITLEESFREAQ